LNLRRSAYLPDEKRPGVEAIDGVRRCSIEIGVDVDEMTVVENDPLQTMMGLKIRPHMFEG
tara:strand:+ start:48433 stop:48615 length:183 start_codon:yes stop_codon:yes gene_type:complete